MKNGRNEEEKLVRES